MAQDDDLENDVDYSDAGGDLASNSMPPAMTSSMKMPAPPPMNPVVADYLQKKQEMAAAQKQAGNNEMYTGLARAGASLAAGIAGSRAPVDQKPFDAMASTDQAPVTNIATAQKSEAADLSNQDAMVESQKKLADSDPNSAQSLAAKAMIKKLYPGKFDDATLAGLSAADVGNSIMKPLELDEKIQAHKDEMESRSADRKESAAARHDAKSTADQSKATNYVVDKLEAARSDQGVKQAQVDLYSAEKVDSLVNLYGDPNNLSLAQVKMLASEVAKIAQGGVPGQHELDGITPNTLYGKMSTFTSNLLNEPTPAHAAEFIKQFQDYSRAVTADARSTIKGKIDSITNIKRKDMGDENYRNVQENYYTRFGLSNDSSAAKPPPSRPALQDLIAEKKRRQQASAPPPTAPVAQAPQAPTQDAPGYHYGYAHGGIVQPPGFHPANQNFHQQRQPAIHAPAGMNSPVLNFDTGGDVPGHPIFQHDDPRNDQVNAKLTPQEIVLPLSITHSKDPAMAAYLYVKHLAGK